MKTFAARLARLVQLIFSPSFPLVLLSLCGVSYLLAAWLAAPEFGLWALVATRAIRSARYDTWTMIALGILVVAALPLAWAALRHRANRPPRALADWAFAAVAIGCLFSLRVVWPYDDSDRQVFAYSFLLFFGWNALVQAVLSSLALLATRRRTRQAASQPPRRASA
jgi:MFS family permease